MTERPIIFAGPMVRAIIEGRKTQTRRVLRDQQPIDLGASMHGAHLSRRAVHDHGELVGHRLAYVKCPYGIPGDRLWVRETGWQRPERTQRMMREGADTWFHYYYDADGLTDVDHEQFKEWGFKRRPAIHMPRWAARLTLEVTGVRVERLQEINESDAQAEGVYTDPSTPARDGFKMLWDSINAKRAPWGSSPWVWVIEFRSQSA